MKELRIRALAKPLSTMRNDPKIETAASFVERLFGRHLKSDPDLLVVTPENREKFLECVKDDFCKGAAFIPFIFFISEEKAQRITDSQGFELIRRKDFLHPRKLRDKWQKGSFTSMKRFRLLEIGGESNQSMRDRIYSRVASAGHFEEENMVVVPESSIPLMLVHELIHSEDYALFGPMRTRLGLTILEGRATYGEWRFTIATDGAYAKPRNLELECIPWVVRSILKNRVKYLRMYAKKHGIRTATEDFIDFWKLTLNRTSFIEQLHYLPYALALKRLSDEINDPYLAFRIATSRIPCSWLDIIRPLEFYKEEIQVAQKGNKR